MDGRIEIARAEIVSAFDDESIGSKVTDEYEFSWILHSVVDDTEFDGNGQEVVRLDETHPRVLDIVSCGVGEVMEGSAFEPRVEQFVLRYRRGSVGKYLRRQFALETKRVDAVVYTKEAYLDDPDVGEEEARRIESDDPTHVLVSVLASPEEDRESPMTPGRLVRNLAGANNAVEEWGRGEIVEKARESIDYWDGRHVVAD